MKNVEILSKRNKPERVSRKEESFFSIRERVNLSSLQKIHLKDCDLSKSMLQSPYIDVRFVL